jgi:hypothetical protein
MSSYPSNTYATKGSIISMEKEKDKKEKTKEIDKNCI